MSYVKLSDKEIEDIYEFLKQEWEKNLRDKGVKLPRLRKPNGKFTKDALVLVYLARGYPDTCWVTKAELTKFVRQFYPETPDVQAGRHLGMQKGFYIVSTRRGNEGVSEKLKRELGGDAYRLKSLNQPHPSWLPKRQKVLEFSFEELKRRYHYRCATCGSKEGEENWRYPTVITKLQMGHMNPRKPLAPSNAIPQCDQCNRADRGKWVYDKLRKSDRHGRSEGRHPIYPKGLLDGRRSDSIIQLPE